jgi:hypothetical protein
MVRRFAFGVVAASLASASVLSCSGLKQADAPADAGDDGSSALDPDATPGDDGSVTADADVDAGTPPSDFECGNDAWVSDTKQKPECAPRRALVVDTDIAIDTTGISIARTPAGRIGIVYNSEIDGENGEMHLAHFIPSSPSFAPTVLKRNVGLYFHTGLVSRIAASAPDVLSILAHDVDDGTQSGDVVMVRLTGGAAPISDPELVVAGVKRPSELGLAIDSSGTIVTTVRIATGATTAKLSAFRKVGAASFAALPDVTTALLPAEAPAVGSASLFVDTSAQFHLLFHYNEVPMHSTPRYHTLDSATWSYRKTVDNAVLDGLSGYSPRVAVDGTRKIAAFFFRKAAQSNPATADLRIARWSLATDTPTIEIVDQGIPSADPLAPQYRVAMAVDKFGLVHLAIVRPTSASAGYLEYRRQTPAPGGGTTWLSDIVDPDVLSAGSEAFVDMVVDGNARPHIAYRSGKDLKVRYATRFDR